MIPIEPHGQRPLVVWREFQHCIAGRDEIGRWLRPWPDANLGVVTGRISGIVVVDVEPRHGGDGSLADVEVRGGIVAGLALQPWPPLPVQGVLRLVHSIERVQEHAGRMRA